MDLRIILLLYLLNFYISNTKDLGRDQKKRALQNKTPSDKKNYI